MSESQTSETFQVIGPRDIEYMTYMIDSDRRRAVQDAKKDFWETEAVRDKVLAAHSALQMAEPPFISRWLHCMSEAQRDRVLAAHSALQFPEPPFVSAWLAMMAKKDFWESEAERDKALADIGAYVDRLLDGSPRLRCATPAEVEGKTNYELKHLLRSRCLKQSGSKYYLIARLTTMVPNVAKLRIKIAKDVMESIKRECRLPGLGDMPEGMCRIQYWLALLNQAMEPFLRVCCNRYAASTATKPLPNELLHLICTFLPTLMPLCPHQGEYFYHRRDSIVLPRLR
jgi:hypothetical protein